MWSTPPKENLVGFLRYNVTSHYSVPRARTDRNVCYKSKRFSKIPPKCFFFKDTWRPPQEFSRFSDQIDHFPFHQLSNSANFFCSSKLVKRGGGLCCKGHIWKQGGFPRYYGKGPGNRYRNAGYRKIFRAKVSAGGLSKNKLNIMLLSVDSKVIAVPIALRELFMVLIRKGDRYLWVTRSYI